MTIGLQATTKQTEILNNTLSYVPVRMYCSIAQCKPGRPTVYKATAGHNDSRRPKTETLASSGKLLMWTKNLIYNYPKNCVQGTATNSNYNSKIVPKMYLNTLILSEQLEIEMFFHHA
jgi:hypothetical protein